MKNKFIEGIYKLQNIKRFANRAVVVYHSPAEHSFYVAQIALFIAEHENMKKDPPVKYNIEKVLRKALGHDIGEVEIGDILYPIKAHDDDIHNKIKAIEEALVTKNLLKHLPTEIQDSFARDILRSKEGNSGRLVALCDQIEVLFYLIEERKLGNLSPWIDEVWQAVTEVTATLSKGIYTGIRLIEHAKEEFDALNKKFKKD